MAHRFSITCIVSLLVSLLVMSCNTHVAQSSAMVNTNVNVEQLRISAWNCRGVKGARPYLVELMQSSDIIALSEHKLYSNELGFLTDLSSDFVATGKSSTDLTPDKYGYVPGHCGVAMLWRKYLSCKVKVMPDLGTDRICAIKLCGRNTCSMYVVSVYLPQARCTISDYDYHLDAIDSIVGLAHDNGDQVLIIGDWNAHFGPECGSRGWGKTSLNGQKAHSMIQAYGLAIPTLSATCTGPTYTFCGEAGGMSYIDHCIISKSLKATVSSCQVIEDSAKNTSDHLALHVEMYPKLNVPGPIREREPYRQTSWHKVQALGVDKLYTEPLEMALNTYQTGEELADTKPSDWSVEQIDKVCSDIITTIKKVDSTLPKYKNKGNHTKSYWTPYLSELAGLKKVAWRNWRDHGRPRNDGNIYWIGYKEAKKALRGGVRASQLQEQTRLQAEVEAAEGLDQRRFWKLINKTRKPRNQHVAPFQKPDGEVLTEEGDIREAWAQYYEQLYTPTDDGYDVTFKQEVEDELARVIPCDNRPSTLRDGEITEEEVSRVIRKLKNNKASGPDGIQAEHIKHGGHQTAKILTDLFNAMIAREHRPQVLKQGWVIPIPKGKKDNTIPDNNRGLTLTSVVAKVYDSVLVKRADEWFQEHTSQLQGASQPKCSSIHTSLLVREVIASNREMNRTVYVAMLDIKKAFDKVWHDGLFYLLKKRGMDMKLWLILRDAYNTFECAVLIAGTASRYFHPRQGIHQGSVWSMKLFCMIMDDLIEELNNSGYGARIGLILCSSPTFADDLTTLALCKEALCQLLGIASRYSRRWRFIFSIEKCVYLCIGTDENPNQKVTLGGKALKEVNYQTHVGIPLCKSKKAEKQAVDDRVRQCRQTLFMIQAVCPTPLAMNPVTASKLYWALCIPKMTYGAEVWGLDTNSVQLMERAHNAAGKVIQGLSTDSPDPVCHATLGWKTVRAHVDIAKLMLLWQLLVLPVSSIYNKVTKARLGQVRNVGGVGYLGPIYDLYITALRYRLLESVHHMLDTGVNLTRNQWRAKVKQAVTSTQKLEWAATVLLYKRLSMYRQLNIDINMIVWWKACRGKPLLLKKCRTLIALVTGGLSLNAQKGHYRSHSRLCQLCDAYQQETPTHFLFDCTGLEQDRTVLVQRLVATMPHGMQDSFNIVNREKTMFLLGTLGETFIAEWQDIYVAVINLVAGLYKARKALLGIG